METPPVNAPRQSIATVLAAISAAKEPVKDPGAPWWKKRTKSPQFLWLLVSLGLLAIGGVFYWMGWHLESLVAVSLFMIAYSASIICGCWRAKSEKGGSLAVLLRRAAEEQRIVHQLKGFCPEHLEITKRRVQTQRECVDLRSKAVAAIPEILIAAGILFSAADSMGILQGIPISSNFHQVVKGTFALALAGLGLCMKYSDFLTSMDLAELREVEFYLESASQASSSKNA